MIDLKTILTNNRNSFGRVLSLNYNVLRCQKLDLSRENSELKNIDFSDPVAHQRYISRKLGEADAVIGIGQYNEDRIIYDHSTVFAGSVRRTIHLGIDLFVNTGTRVLCPLTSKVHSFQNNIGQGDYGPTIILEHQLQGVIFYTLYGHLSLESLKNLHVGKVFVKGDIIGTVGDMDVNGGWPAHLHFQIISDLLNMSGDYPGVCSVADRHKFLELCPNPNIILNIKEIE